MEDMARLALVEQNVRDMDTFSKILHELLRHINYILENPHDYELRTIKNEVLKKQLLEYESFVDYLKSIGFRSIGNEFTYPKEHTLSNLRVAQAALERKIYFCCGPLGLNEVKVRTGHGYKMQARKPKFIPVKVLTTTNPLLLKIERLFNDMIKYEDEELQELAREYIPLVTLQLMAIDRMREHQRKLKAGEIKGHDLPFDVALLMELLGWFKYKFFRWVDEPACERCGGVTRHHKNTSRSTGTEICNVEVYKCTQCTGGAEFVRHNEPRALLRTRRGRCGEWANCFALLCRALGYDARYVYDTTDHVWCEVFDYDMNTWLHVDPCEGKLDAPLLYSHGWNKQLSYVIAVSRDDLQDVTWRYTTDHKQVLKRRTACSESELTSAIMTLREARQRQVSDARRHYLARRCLEELAQLMVERKPGDSETHGRTSGSEAWRSGRGELGARGHVVRLARPGGHRFTYCAAGDLYRVSGGGEDSAARGWGACAHRADNIFRKVEEDWKMVYLARKEGEATGSISWQLSAEGGLSISSLTVRASSAQYEDGAVSWTVTFDDDQPASVQLGDTPTTLNRRCQRVVIAATLAGGRGDTAWQHAQLFRQPVDSNESALEILATVE